jgi:hypothetical protein
VSLALGLALSLASAFALNWGWVAQHGAASALSPLRLRAPLRSLRLLFANVRWLVGFVVGLGGWALYIVALALAPLSLVQAVSAGGIAILALLVHRRSTRLVTREWNGVMLGTAGLVLLAATLGGGATTSHLRHASGGLVWLGGSAAAAALAPLLLRGAAGLGIAAGTLYAAGDVATKAALGGGGRVLFAPAVLAAHGLAFVCLQLGFQRGSALATAGLSTLFTNALPIAAGITIFDEHLPGGAAGDARIAAFALVVGCAALLARPDRGDATPPHEERVAPEPDRHRQQANAT